MSDRRTDVGRYLSQIDLLIERQKRYTRIQLAITCFLALAGIAIAAAGFLFETQSAGILKCAGAVVAALGAFPVAGFVKELMKSQTLFVLKAAMEGRSTRTPEDAKHVEDLFWKIAEKNLLA